MSRDRVLYLDDPALPFPYRIVHIRLEAEDVTHTLYNEWYEKSQPPELLVIPEWDRYLFCERWVPCTPS